MILAVLLVSHIPRLFCCNWWRFLFYFLEGVRWCN